MTVRNAVRVFIIKDGNVVAIKYNENNVRYGYYDTPGGKIEEGETGEQAAIREVKEETGIELGNIEEKGILVIKYPNRTYHFIVYTAKEWKGQPQNFEENESMWIEIKEVLNEKILTNMILLNPQLINALLGESTNFEMEIEVEEDEIITKVQYELKRK